jgi:hypothetical protein
MKVIVNNREKKRGEETQEELRHAALPSYAQTGVSISRVYEG